MLSLEWDEQQFTKYTRMSKDQFSYLHKLVKPYLKRDPKKRHVSSEQRLIMTLHYLSEGCSMQEIAWGYRVGLSTARNIIIDTCKVLWDTLNESQLPVPNTEDFIHISETFLKKWNIPNCVGALDGKHVELRAPKNSGSEFFNYKKSFSVVLMAVCDANMRFTMIDVGASGSNHDSIVFKNSGMGMALFNGDLKIPPPKSLPKTNIVLPYYLIADAGFPLHTNIIRPYPGSHLGEKKNICNYRISRARRTIESAFGILSQRWRILRNRINACIEVCEHIIHATIVLHNFLQQTEEDIPPEDRHYCPTGFSDWIDLKGDLHDGTWREEGQGLRSVGRLGSNNASNLAKDQRDLLAEYFVSIEGWVPWQENYVNRGGLPTD
ncbi:protein ALP1-like [Sitophilus oryzae]|uniref:Protein ALP1-like n=1 Tax=Sitophilus oryzae TaxID=7048 RepID=A0A6J2YGR1_SITOR|nr:protein ALP1-like [Sitophilus oryzae]